MTSRHGGSLPIEWTRSPASDTNDSRYFETGLAVRQVELSNYQYFDAQTIAKD